MERKPNAFKCRELKWGEKQRWEGKWEREKKKNKLCGTNTIQMHYQFRWAFYFIYICFVLYVCVCRIHINVLMLTKVFSMDSYCKCFHFAYIYAKTYASIFFWIYLHLNYLRLCSMRLNEPSTGCASFSFFSCSIFPFLQSPFTWSSSPLGLPIHDCLYHFHLNVVQFSMLQKHAILVTNHCSMVWHWSSKYNAAFNKYTILYMHCSIDR